MKRGTIIWIIVGLLIITPVAIAAIHGPVYPIQTEAKGKAKTGIVSSISRFSKKGDAPK